MAKTHENSQYVVFVGSFGAPFARQEKKKANVYLVKACLRLLPTSAMKNMKISTLVKVRVVVKANERVQGQQANVKEDQQLLEAKTDK